MQVPFSAVSGASEDYENETFVWGTTIRAQKVSRDFVNFFELFIEEGGFEAKYIKLMREVRETAAVMTRNGCSIAGLQQAASTRLLTCMK